MTQLLRLVRYVIPFIVLWSCCDTQALIFSFAFFF